MKKSELLKAVCIMALFIFIFGMTACDRGGLDKDETHWQQTTDSVIKSKDYVGKTVLNHLADTVQKIKIADQMASKLTIWRTSGDGAADKVFENETNLKMEASAQLAYEDYFIKANRLSISPSAQRIIRAPNVADADGETEYELDTVYYVFPDAQVLSIPIKVTNKTVTIAGLWCRYASLTLDHVEFVHLKNTEITTGPVYTRTPYRTEYKVFLYFKETNVDKPRMLKFPLYAYTTRYADSDDEIVAVRAENKLRELLDSLTERCSFDRVRTYKSGKVTRDNISVVLQHGVAVGSSQSKVVSNFNYQLAGINGIANGTESKNRTEGYWTVWRKTDEYSAYYENGVNADKITVVRLLMHERCCYTDEYLTVDFGYENYRVSDEKIAINSCASDWPGYAKALFEHRVNVTYIGSVQNVAEHVSLYK